MEWFKDSNIDFQHLRRPAMGLSALAILIGIISIVLHGLAILIGIISIVLHGGPNYSIDFLGGTSLQLRFEKPVSEGEVRDALTEINLSGSEVKRISEIGAEPEILIRIKKTDISETTIDQIKSAISSSLPENPFDTREPVRSPIN